MEGYSPYELIGFGAMDCNCAYDEVISLVE